MAGSADNVGKLLLRGEWSSYRPEFLVREPGGVKVFAEYAEAKAGLVRAWMQSWKLRGWHPRLITEREKRWHGTTRRAIKARGGGHLTELRIINFSCTPRRRAQRVISQVGKPGWETADLVRFPTRATDQEVRSCGRPL